MMIIITYATREKDGTGMIRQYMCEEVREQYVREKIMALDNFICFSEDFRGTLGTGCILPIRVRSKAVELNVREV